MIDSIGNVRAGRGALDDALIDLRELAQNAIDSAYRGRDAGVGLFPYVLNRGAGAVEPIRQVGGRLYGGLGARGALRSIRVSLQRVR